MFVLHSNCFHVAFISGTVVCNLCDCQMWLEYLLFLKKLSLKAKKEALEAKSSSMLKGHFSAVKEVRLLVQ